jgi:hypothetical protein
MNILRDRDRSLFARIEAAQEFINAGRCPISINLELR